MQWAKQIATAHSFRWLVFTKYELDATQSFYTMDTLQFKTFRSPSVCLALIKSHIATQNLPPPQDYSMVGNEIDNLMIQY